MGISTDNIIHDENKLGWYDTSANQIAYVGAAMSAGQGTYGNAVAFSSGVVNYWRFQETSGTTVWDTVGSANLSLVAPYTQGTASLVANDTNDKSYTFTGGYAYIPVSYGEDAFDGGTIGANLNARTALYGGAWATLGATGDYTLYGNITPSNVIRTTSNDASGRFAILGTTSFGAESLVETNISFDFTSNASGKLEMGLVARYVDANNYLRAVYRRDSTDPVTNWKAQIVKVKAGVETILATGTPPSGWGAQYSGKLSLSITNGYNIQFTARVGPNQVVVSSTAYDSDLSSGALSTGKTGLYDILTGPGSGTKARFFYDFKSSVPSKNFQQQNLTFEAWLKPTTVDATDRIIWEVVEPSLTRDNSGLRITHSTAGIKIWTVVGGVWKLCTTVAGALSTSTQTHIAVSLISFLRAKVWKNGVIASTYTPAGGSQAQSDLQLSGSGAGQLSIGASSAGTLQYLGVMDDMVFYQTEVSDSIIANHYNIGNQGATPLASIKARVRVPGGTEYIRTVLDESGNSDFALKTDIPVIPAGVGSGMDFTTPAGNYTTTTTLTPLTWFCTVAAGPNQEWDLDATLGVQATTATWGKVNARIIGQSNAGGALPAGATVDLNHISSVATNNAWSGAIALFAKARLITTGAFVAQTLRIMCEVQHVTAVNTVIRDGNTVRVWARRMV